MTTISTPTCSNLNTNTQIEGTAITNLHHPPKTEMQSQVDGESTVDGNLEEEDDVTLVLDGLTSDRTNVDPSGSSTKQETSHERKSNNLRRTIDYRVNMMTYLQQRKWQRGPQDRPAILPRIDDLHKFEPMFCNQDNPAFGICTKFVALGINKQKTPIYSVQWTRNAQRVITGAHTGQLTLWNGLTFNFETIEQAHEFPIRVLRAADAVLLSGDEKGTVKVWKSTLDMVAAFRAHKETVRDIAVSPLEAKFATASDDKTISIWDLERRTEDRNLTGHGWDVKTVAWHPQKALLASGGRDQIVMLWDPRPPPKKGPGGGDSSGSIGDLIGHKNTVNRVCWSPEGVWLASGGKDNLVKIWDLRMLRAIETYRVHRRDVTALAWNPQAPRVLCSGSFDGSMYFYIVGAAKMSSSLSDVDAIPSAGEAQAEICGAHGGAVWDLAWHPLGHLLVSGSQDNTIKFWTRNRPGDEMTDRYNANELPSDQRHNALVSLVQAESHKPAKKRLRMPAALFDFETMPVSTAPPAADSNDVIPGLGSAAFALRQLAEAKAKRSLPAPSKCRVRILGPPVRVSQPGNSSQKRL